MRVQMWQSGLQQPLGLHAHKAHVQECSLARQRMQRAAKPSCCAASISAPVVPAIACRWQHRYQHSIARAASSDSSRHEPRKRATDAAEGKALDDIASLLDDKGVEELEQLAASSSSSRSNASVVPSYSGTTARVVGSLLGAMVGNALGIQLEPEPHHRLTRLFPEGIQTFWDFDINLAKVKVPPGCVTGDFLQMTAVARSLVKQGALDLVAMTNAMAMTYMVYPSDSRRYSPYLSIVAEALCQDVALGGLAQRAEAMLDLTPERNASSSSNREGRQRVGAGDATAVLRVTPVALAYADADAGVLQEAVDTAVVFSHPLPSGRDGALMHAAAVAWLSRADPASPGCTPAALLQHLQQLPLSAESLHLLGTVAAAAEQQAPFPRISSWRQFWKSKEWHRIVACYQSVSLHNFALQGNQAAAVALLALLGNWQQPEQAVMMAAALGGNAGTTTALTGALVGALHGCAWVPARWWEQLEDVGYLEAQQKLLLAAAEEAATSAPPHLQLDRSALLQELQAQAAQEAAQGKGTPQQLDGSQQVLAPWVEEEQQAWMGRGALVSLAEQLAEVRCTTVAPARLAVPAAPGVALYE